MSIIITIIGKNKFYDNSLFRFGILIDWVILGRVCYFNCLCQKYFDEF